MLKKNWVRDIKKGNSIIIFVASLSHSEPVIYTPRQGSQLLFPATTS